MIFTLFRLAISSVLLVYASACDIATREVSDWVWLLGIPVCVLLDSVDLYLGRVDPLSLIVSRFPMSSTMFSFTCADSWII